MPAIGPAEILVFLVLAGIVVYFGLHRRVSGGVLLILVLVLSPFVAYSLALLVGAVLSALSV